MMISSTEQMSPNSLLSRERIRRALSVLWVLACVWLLVRTLGLRNAPAQMFYRAEEIDFIYMFALSNPLSVIGLLWARWIGFNWWVYSQNDARTILAIWLYFFAMGAVQWFVLVPWLVHKGFDVYGRFALLFHRKRRS